MGVDVLLYAEATPTAQELEAARTLFRRSNIADDYTTDDGVVRWQCLEIDDEDDEVPPRVVANVTTRYYGEGYERGHWPSIYGAIRLLCAAFPTARIFYGGDTDDSPPELTATRLADLWDHWTGPNGDAYHARWATPTDDAAQAGTGGGA